MSFRSTNETFRFLQFAVLFMTASLVVTSTCLGQGSEGKIAFFSNRHDDSGIYIMDADGANPFRLIGGGGPAWSPDGAQIALYGGNGVGSDIFVVDANGNNLRSLTKSRIDGNRFPVWSPDGSKIAFVSDRDGQIDIYLMTADGKNPRNLTFDLREEDRPSWSPDGKRVVFGAYQRNPQGNRAESEVFVMDADGANRVNLTQNPRALNSYPSWSPDGKKIVFTRREPDGTHDIYSINLDGSGLINLTQTPRVEDLSPSWRPARLSVPSQEGLATQWGRVKQNR